MATRSEEPCEECGLPLVECSALALARLNVVQYLRDHGRPALQSRADADRLIPHVKRK